MLMNILSENKSDTFRIYQSQNICHYTFYVKELDTRVSAGGFFLLFFAKDIEKVLENYINIRQIRSIKCSIPFFSKFLLFQKLFFRGYFSMILPVRGATVATSVD